MITTLNPVDTDCKLVALSIELTYALRTLARDLERQADALVDGAITPQAAHRLSVDAAVLAHTADRFSVAVARV